MFSLPRSSSGIEVVNQGQRSFLPGRNLLATPFQQFSIDGQIKKEFLPYKSSTPDQTVSDEVKLANWGNMQQKLTAQNLDDIAQDIIFLKTQMAEEKQKNRINNNKA